MRPPPLVSPSAIAVLIALLAGAFLTAKPICAMDIVLVVDTSGSMAWDIHGNRNHPRFEQAQFDKDKVRIDLVLRALENYATRLPEGTRLRLISFNTGIKTNQEFRIDDVQRQKLLEAIRNLKSEVNPEGDTWLWEAMREGIRYAEQYAQEDPDVSVSLYVITDGAYHRKPEHFQRPPVAVPDDSLAKVLDGSPLLNSRSDALIASLVLLGRLQKDPDDSRAFPPDYFERLKQEANDRCHVELDPEFDLLFPPILVAMPNPARKGQTIRVFENSESLFVQHHWSFKGPVSHQGQSTSKILEFTGNETGRYSITFVGHDTKNRRARGRKVIRVEEPVLAKPIVKIDGANLDPQSPIYLGQMLALTHESVGPVQAVTWTINSETFNQPTVTKQLDQLGPYSITLKVLSQPDDLGVQHENTSPPVTFHVLPPKLEPQPQVLINDKPWTEVQDIFVGARLQLTQTAKQDSVRAIWHINGQKLENPEINKTLNEPGDYEIFLEWVTEPVKGRSISEKSSLIRFSVREREPIIEVKIDKKNLSEVKKICVGNSLHLELKLEEPLENIVWNLYNSDTSTALPPQTDKKARFDLNSPGNYTISVAYTNKQRNYSKTKQGPSFQVQPQPNVFFEVSLIIILILLWALSFKLLLNNGYKFWKVSISQIQNPNHNQNKDNVENTGINVDWSWDFFNKSGSCPFSKMMRDFRNIIGEKIFTEYKNSKFILNAPSKDLVSLSLDTDKESRTSLTKKIGRADQSKIPYLLTLSDSKKFEISLLPSYQHAPHHVFALALISFIIILLICYFTFQLMSKFC